ncbi:amino acid permease/ SLC12A domain-containing protein [Xylariaceae sp. FL0594]|nr:amino acid permease/ SLC12A domain-containing protein [Xylariaceae sp. FL0594]
MAPSDIFNISTIENVAAPTTPPPTPDVPDTTLRQVISTRQFVFMALSSSIGAGFLVSTSQALAVGGPAPLLIAFAVVGFSVWITMCALGELSTSFPVKGSFYEFSVRFISPAWGFAMGWNYVMNFVFVLPFELIVIVMCARFWNPNLPAEELVPACIVGLAFIYAFGARWYAEAENIFGVLKMSAIAVFVVTGLLILCRAVPTDPRPASELAYNSWDTSAFKNGGIGFLFVFMSVGVAFGGTEMLGLTAAECRSPKRVMRLASVLAAGRIFFLYFVPTLILGLILKINLDGSGSKALISPFVMALADARISVLPDVVNGIIIVSIFSMANASIFASSRALQAISTRGMGPRFCSLVWRGRPVGALSVVFAFSLLAFAKVSPHGDDVFVWLLALASCSNYLTWCSICVCHIRLHLAMRRQGRSTYPASYSSASQSSSDPASAAAKETGTYRAPLGIAGSAFSVVVFLFGLIAQVVAAVRSLLPSPPAVASSFLGLVVVFVFWAGYILWKRDWTLIIPLDQIDLGPKEEVDLSLSFTEGGRV